MSVLRFAALLLLPMAACSGPSSSIGNPQPVTLIVVNARVWTADPTLLWAEAVAIAGDRIAAVGSTSEIQAMADEGVQTIDARGGLIVPGLIDSHVHFIDSGFRLASVQLREARTRKELTDRVGVFAETVPDGTWITGGDWDHEQWGGELPHRAWIDAVTPNHPVWVNRLDGHMALANSAALRAAGVTRATEDVPGGTIVRDARGEPTGVLKDNAMALVARVLPDPTPAQADRALDAAMRHVAAQGVTTVHNMGSWTDLETFARARKAERLTTRIYAIVPLADWERLRDLIKTRRFGDQGRGDEWLRVGGLKGFVDGSLGSHTAAFEQPFSDAPQDRGLLVTPLAELYKNISDADVAYLQVMIHAIGDRANRELLDAFARVAAKNGKRDRRWRIEHAQHLRPADISRFVELGVIASMQPYHAIDDGRWAEKVIGAERAKTTYAFRSLLDAGATLAFGSDWFVAPPTPLEGIYAAVTRRTLDGKHPDGWVPEQKITVEEALRAYTHDGAVASFDDGLKGTITPGKLADLVLIDRDLFRVPPAEIRQARVLWTMVGGRMVYERESQEPTTSRKAAAVEMYRGPEADTQPREYRTVSTQASHDALLSGDTASWAPATKVTWGPERYRTSFSALWSERGIYVRFDATDERPWQTMTRRDDKLWNEEVVEIFLDPTGSGQNYAELEISPTNVVCDLRIVQVQPWKSEIGWNLERLASRVHPWPQGGGDGWSAVAFLSYDDLRTLSPDAAGRMPPSAGARWRFNVFRIKRPAGPAEPDRGVIYAAWSVPDGPTFHQPAVFRDFVFR